MHSSNHAEEHAPLGLAARGHVIVIEPNEQALAELEAALGEEGFEVTACATTALGLRHLGKREPSVVVANLSLPDVEKGEFLTRLGEYDPSVPLILLVEAGSLPSGVRLLRRGAYDCVVRPFSDRGLLSASIRRALERQRLKQVNQELKQSVCVRERFRQYMGISPAIQPVLSRLETAAEVASHVLVEGEEGTGKSLIAWAIHERSRRAGRPFVSVDCSVLARKELDAVLFGCAGPRASFRRGVLEEASTGTLFLDSIDQMTEPAQAGLIRVLDEGVLLRPGRGEARPIDVRIVAACRGNLMNVVEEGQFRRDLFERLRAITISVPTLRERISDLPLLVQHFLDKAQSRHAPRITGIAPEALKCLADYAWPGNLPELESAVVRAIARAAGDTLTADLFPEIRVGTELASSTDLKPTQTLANAGAAFERNYLERILRYARGNAAEAARHAGLDRSNFRRLLKRYGIDRKAFTQS